ncbi:hypothetical protein D8T51_23300 [Vibrio vulnificus]|nr:MULTISPECIES: hypothetical protein [Vibrio]EHK2851220.1 hypothetical protein [Vibrio parahaemolyticus]ELH3492570.1 hypothetical protein [Vibrio vulnificus]MBE3758573.1 hypothetical protein [Vibrio parahaemolyticus]MCA3958248.1 hypothetical protein [Vibrio vulnificus]NIY85455.1 hypothetical protein [Vibrio hepatarius]
MSNTPKWFEVGSQLIGEVSGVAMQLADQLSDLSLDSKTSVQCSVLHYVQCLMASADANREGKHAIALSLTRQSVEALTLIECGFLKDRSLSSELVTAWVQGSKSSGAIRKRLSQNVWQLYSKSLWSQGWGEYFGEFCSSIQPYAHYSRELQGWQLEVIDNATLEDCGSITLNMKFGFDTYDSNKATRITLIHILLSWTLGKIITNNVSQPELEHKLDELQQALEVCPELGKGQLDWAQQLWASEFTKPQEMT